MFAQIPATFSCRLRNLRVSTSNGQTILVLSPHPDDETLGCGGTIKLLTDAGAAVDVLYLTRGELGVEAPETTTAESRQQLAETRAREAREACRLLGVRQVDFLDGADGRLAEHLAVSDELRRRLREGRYNRVFCPWPGDHHPDHIATFGFLRQALGAGFPSLQVWLYEVWAPLRPTICVPIDPTIEAKLAAIRAHRSQLECLDYWNAFRGLAAYRSLFCPGARFAEAFIVADSSAIRGMH